MFLFEMNIYHWIWSIFSLLCLPTNIKFGFNVFLFFQFVISAKFAKQAWARLYGWPTVAHAASISSSPSITMFLGGKDKLPYILVLLHYNTRDLTAIIVENWYSDPSSNPGWGCLHFSIALIIPRGKVCIPLFWYQQIVGQVGFFNLSMATSVRE